MSRTRQGGGRVFVIAGPSGSGKTTIYKRLLKEEAGINFSVSATTRIPRGGECDGQDYYFISREEFFRRRSAGEFVEWAEVHGNYYGTLRKELSRKSAAGQVCVLDVDVQGAASLRQGGLDADFIFIVPPSLEVLEERLRTRGTEDEATLALRLKNAAKELEAAKQFDYVVVNDRLDQAYAEVRDLIIKAKQPPGHSD